MGRARAARGERLGKVSEFLGRPTSLAEVSAEAEARSWLVVEIEEQEEEAFRQATRGRPSKQTPCRKQTRSRFTLTWKLNVEALFGSRARGWGLPSVDQ